MCLRRKIAAIDLNGALALATSFIPNQDSTVSSRMNGTQMKPAFCSHSEVACPAWTTCCGCPPKPSNSAVVMAYGTTSCIADTPRLPSPALMPRAKPLRACGKKKLMLAMLDAKLPPPKPLSSASASMIP
ncbi:hypothetical protein GALL_520790 [mine drainage metagenome]|uniref:Uncharacterized protein n=1 Tax=mine drainage metagenome TaxID=410659 RepID=A0A1J5P6G4_9ZZZZ